MKDRISASPGRVLITPESGAAFYATMTRADNPTQEGDSLSKNTLLKDSTAEALGLSDAALPDDALRILSRLHAGLGNEYLWSVTAGAATIIQGAETTYGAALGESMYYSENVEISGGSIVMVNAVSFTSGDAVNTNVIGNYIKTAAGVIYYCVTAVSNGSGRNVSYTVKPVSIAQPGVIGYVNSPNPNAYPPAEDDGYTYQALGMLGEKVRIAAGSYTGTGNYGSGNANSLTFDFAPKAVIISAPYYADDGISSVALISGMTNVGTVGGSNAAAQFINTTWSGNTVSWYNTANAAQQLNRSNTVYRYLAIG